MDKAREESLSLEKLRNGDRAEFAQLMDKYSGIIYRLSLKMVENPQDAEDVLQETFIKAFRGLPRFDGRSSLSTWLYRIAVNESLMHLRRRKQPALSIDQPLETEDDQQEPTQIVDFCCMPEKELMSFEAQLYMDKAVESLQPNLKAVFLLRDIEGLSTEETADALNLSQMAVKTRLSRARMKLRNLLSEYYGERMAKDKIKKEQITLNRAVAKVEGLSQ